jgi:hypothetical protein
MTPREHLVLIWLSLQTTPVCTRGRLRSQETAAQAKFNGGCNVKINEDKTRATLPPAN